MIAIWRFHPTAPLIFEFISSGIVCWFALLRLRRSNPRVSLGFSSGLNSGIILREPFTFWVPNLPKHTGFWVANTHQSQRGSLAPHPLIAWWPARDIAHHAGGLPGIYSSAMAGDPGTRRLLPQSSQTSQMQSFSFAPNNFGPRENQKSKSGLAFGTVMKTYC